MAKTGSSIEIEILANTKKYDAETKRLVNDAKNLQKSLAIDFDGKKYADAQKLMREAIERTDSKAVALKNQLRNLESAGKVDTSEYKNLNSQLIKTEAEAVQLKQKLQEIKLRLIILLMDSKMPVIQSQRQDKHLFLLVQLQLL
jgi:hypothetical protein